MAKVKVLSLMQPWAELVVLPNAKGYETRSWKPSPNVWKQIVAGGNELYIHASKKFLFGDLELCRQDKHFAKFIPDPTKLRTGAIIGKVKFCAFKSTDDREFVNGLSVQERTFGDYTPERWAWFLEKPVKFKHPIEVSGALSIWDFELGSHCSSCGLKSDRLLTNWSQGGKKMTSVGDSLCPSCVHDLAISQGTRFKSLAEINEERRKEAQHG